MGPSHPSSKVPESGEVESSVLALTYDHLRGADSEERAGDQGVGVLGEGCTRGPRTCTRSGIPGNLHIR